MTLVGDFVTGQTVPFQRMRAIHASGALQEGVVGALDFQVTQRAAGANMSVDVAAGDAWVRIDTGTNNGLAHVLNDASANVVVSASNGTNPRIDQIVLRYNDASIPTGSGNTPTLEVVTGTATSGATLDNRTGAASLPNDCLRLADLLIPATSTSVTTANIRDRRPWARGAHFYVVQATGANYTTASGTAAQIDATNLAARIECSGVPVEVDFHGYYNHSVTSGVATLDLDVDALLQSRRNVLGSSTAGGDSALNIRYKFTPAAGSHTIDVRWAVATAGTATIIRSATFPLVWSIRELPLQNASNT